MKFCSQRMHCVLSVLFLVQCVGSVGRARLSDFVQEDDQSALGNDYDEESGEGAMHAPSCDCGHLEDIVNAAVDSKIRKLEERLQHRGYGRSSHIHSLRHNTALSHVDPNKAKIKSLEFRVLRLYKDVEDTKSMFQRQAESLQQTKQLVHTQTGKLAGIQAMYENLQTVVGKLSAELETLAEILASKHSDKFSPQYTTLSTSGKTAELYPKDCDEVFQRSGKVFHGDYYIMIRPSGAPEPIMVLCRVFNRTAWTVIQKRCNGSQDFYKTWRDYKTGFGDIEDEFWLGNDNIHHLTTSDKMVLRIEMEDWNGGRYHAEYSLFSIDSEKDLYRLHVSGFHGNAGDSLTSAWENHDGNAFSTYDNDNDARHYDNCAERFHGAWWFNNCFGSHLNGKYFHKDNHRNYFIRNGIQWNTIHMYSSLKSTVMMVRPHRKFDGRNSLKDM